MKIAVFTEHRLLRSDTSDTRYLCETLRRHFDVRIFARPDASLCGDCDVVFTRFPLPINKPFLQDLARYRDKLVINRPTTQLTHTKRALLSFPSLTAPTIVSAAPEAIRAFASTHGMVVFKPLDRHKGHGVMTVDVSAQTPLQLENFITRYVDAFGTPMVQKYLADVATTGDKRINVIWFEPVSAVVTFPAPGSFICHESAGGTAYAANVTDRDRAIVDALKPFLRANGVYWAAIDVIGSYLGEINLLTPAMLLRADQAHENDAGAMAIVGALRQHNGATSLS